MNQAGLHLRSYFRVTLHFSAYYLLMSGVQLSITVRINLLENHYLGFGKQ